MLPYLIGGALIIGGVAFGFGPHRRDWADIGTPLLGLAVSACGAGVIAGALANHFL